jgi:hypothetical protein
MPGIQAPVKTQLGPPVASTSLKGKGKQIDDGNDDLAAPLLKGKGLTDPIKAVEVCCCRVHGLFSVHQRWL